MNQGSSERPIELVVIINSFNRCSLLERAMTSLTPHGAKIPIHFDTDREAIGQALASLAIPDVRQAKVVRIADTLSLVSLEVSEAFDNTVGERADLEAVGELAEMKFDLTDNLVHLRGG